MAIVRVWSSECRHYLCFRVQRVRYSTRTQFLHAWAITYHRIHSLAHQSQRSTTAAALSATDATWQGQSCSCYCFKIHQTDLLLCFCTESQTSKEVDQDPEVGLTRQYNETLCVRLYSFRFTLFIIRRRWRMMSGLSEEPEELFVSGQALSLMMFWQDTSARSLFVFICRRSETSTFDSRRAVDVQWSRIWTRDSATSDPVSWSCVVYGNHYHKTLFHNFSFHFLKLRGMD